jgi:Ni,Fe-hydrogenase III component G
MTRDEILKDITTRFKADITSVLDRSPGKVYIDISRQALLKIVEHAFRGLKGRFNTLTGVDRREHMEMLYHFTFEDVNLIVSFRIKLDKSHLEIESITPIVEGANWVERETFEVLGVQFKGHPDLRRLLLPEDWPEGVYPLRRDYQEWDKGAIRDRGV